MPDMPDMNQDHKKITSTLSRCSMDSGVGIMLTTSHLETDSTSLEEVGEERQDSCSCEESSHIGDPDLVIRVEGHLIPVHSSVISEYSVTLRTMMMTLTQSDSDRTSPVVCLRGHSVENVNELIDFAYFPEKEIDGANVFHVLRLAEDFVAGKLKTRCEDFLMSSDIYHPLDLCHIATEYNLKRLLAQGIKKASKIPRVNFYADFDELEYSTRVKIERAMEVENNLNNNDINNSSFVEEGYKSEEDQSDARYDADSESEESD